MFERQVLRGFIASVDVIPPLVVTFQFNPGEIKDNKAVKYSDREGSLCGSGPGKQYTGGGDRTITFDIEILGIEQGTNRLNPTAVDNGISTELAKLRSFLYPREDAWAVAIPAKQGKRLSPPPTCIFGYGTRILDCWVNNVQITEKQFNSMLAPVRATASITLTVREDADNALYQLDRQRRNALAALGLLNTSVL